VAKRFEIIKRVIEPYWLEGSPIVMQAHAVVLDTVTNDVFAQMKFLNKAEKPLSGMDLSVLPLSPETGDGVGTIDGTYSGLSVSKDETFGSDKLFLLPQRDIRSYAVLIKKVSFTDGEIWDYKAGFILKSTVPTDPGAEVSSVPTTILEPTPAQDLPESSPVLEATPVAVQDLPEQLSEPLATPLPDPAPVLAAETIFVRVDPEPIAAPSPPLAPKEMSVDAVVSTPEPASAPVPVAEAAAEPFAATTTEPTEAVVVEPVAETTTEHFTPTVVEPVEAVTPVAKPVSLESAPALASVAVATDADQVKLVQPEGLGIEENSDAEPFKKPSSSALRNFLMFLLVVLVLVNVVVFSIFAYVRFFE